MNFAKNTWCFFDPLLFVTWMGIPFRKKRPSHVGQGLWDTGDNLPNPSLQRCRKDCIWQITKTLCFASSCLFQQAVGTPTVPLKFWAVTSHPRVYDDLGGCTSPPGRFQVYQPKPLNRNLEDQQEWATLTLDPQPRKTGHCLPLLLLPWERLYGHLGVS